MAPVMGNDLKVVGLVNPVYFLSCENDVYWHTLKGVSLAHPEGCATVRRLMRTYWVATVKNQ
mgnify:CR=1 FL=1